ncbi:hypothetical protein [Nitrosomonas communis]|uniref:Uncharacterized protein n=1 Tax=Nitrosomonas communis TaxID=44574 RepID=A0A1I4S643_9PROT|nr:hypothetical protein [Nitrosomonas communis]SFM59740.1 hypothetical protein SAMN05421863_10381 [Nitrosomonas communis]
MDANSLDSMNADSVIEPGCERSFPHRCRATVAQQAIPDRWPARPVTAYGIYRTYFQGRFQLEVIDIVLPKIAGRRRIITGVTIASPVSYVSFIRFIFSLCRRWGGARKEGECLKWRSIIEIQKINNPVYLSRICFKF